MRWQSGVTRRELLCNTASGRLRSQRVASVHMPSRPRGAQTSSLFSPSTSAMPTCPVTDAATLPRKILTASPREECRFLQGYVELAPTGISADSAVGHAMLHSLSHGPR